MLDSIYHYDTKIILKSYFWRKNVRVLPYVKMMLEASFHNVSRKSEKH